MAKYKLKKRLKRYNTYVHSKEYYEERDKLEKEILERLREFNKIENPRLEDLFSACYGAQISHMINKEHKRD
jgi:coproporphyrinogen III oxidase-like Fe-S oxidoreductase